MSGSIWNPSGWINTAWAQFISYILLAVGAVTRTVYDKLAEHVSLRDFGAIGDNTSDIADTAALIAAINYANTATYPVVIEIPAGLYRINTASLPAITRTAVFRGASVRGTVIFPIGSLDLFKFIGVTSRVANAGIESLCIDARFMTAGNAIALDWTQGFSAKDVLIASPFSGIYIRQCGETKLRIRIDTGRGGYGVKVYGDGSTRNGELDKCDVIDFGPDTTITGDYAPGDPVPTFEAVILDGFVHTVTFGSLRMLSCLRGLRTANTAGLAQQFVPSFIFGKTLEIENTWLEGVYIVYANDIQTNLFQSTSVSENGVYFGISANQVKLGSYRVTTNWKSGVYIAGAQDVQLMSGNCFRNGLAGAGAYSGIYINSGDNISMFGGRIGKPPYDTGGAYTENQQYGINNIAGTNVKTVALLTTGNATAGTNGTITVI